MAVAQNNIVSEPESLPSNTISIEDKDTCISLQKEELQVLESIFPDHISKGQSDGHLRLEVPIELGVPHSVKLYDSGEERQTVTISILPPILLRVALPPSYPLYSPPTIVSIRTTDAWLPDPSSICTVLNRIWKPEDVICVLYFWVERIRSGDILRDLGILSTDNNSLQIPHPNPSLAASLLYAYDSSSQSAQFSINSYPCGICLENLKGTKCVQLACCHVFCRSCLEDFWGLCISEGDIDRVGCPDPDCVKQGHKASDGDVSRVMTEPELQRWRWLQTKQELERDPTILNCPVPTCQSLVLKPKGVDPLSGWDRFRQCSNCFCSFCSFCKHAWHGPLSACPLPFTEKVMSEYLATPEDSPERTNLEMRYGKTTVMRLLAQHDEQKATESWITESTSVCPGCRSHVQKSEGCNYMTCTRCTNHFCYRCGVQLNPKEPYAHFQLPGTYCFEKLFAADEEQGDQNVEDLEGYETDEGQPGGGIFD